MIRRRPETVSLSLLAFLWMGCSGADVQIETPETATPSSTTKGVAVSEMGEHRRARLRGKTSAVETKEEVDCAPTESAAACFVCCEDTHAEAVRLRAEALRECACAPSRCATAGCGGAYCDGKGDASAACLDCIDTVFTECVAAVETKCKANARCRELDACVDQNRCAQKP